jgi:ADP-heptose:LPS heptosyltransferase
VKNYFRIIRLARKKGYDLAIDFRGDLRLMVMMFLCGIPERLGYGRTGGEFLLTKRIPYD